MESSIWAFSGHFTCPGSLAAPLVSGLVFDHPNVPFIFSKQMRQMEFELHKNGLNCTNLWDNTVCSASSSGVLEYSDVLYTN